MRPSLRLFAAATPRGPSKLRQPKGSLSAFIWKRRVLSVYRDIVRALNKIPPSPIKDEMRNYARQGFEQNRNVTEEMHIRYLISTAKAELKTMGRYIDQMSHR